MTVLWVASGTTQADGPMVRWWQQSEVNEYIRVVFDASTKHSDGEAEIKVDEDAENHRNIESGEIFELKTEQSRHRVVSTGTGLGRRNR